MTAQLAYHVFCHKDGRYQTASAAGLQPHELQSLEQFFFGQTNDARYLDSLKTEPGVIWRRIGTRVALTRVTQGPTDSNGRSTLRFATLLEDQGGKTLTRTVTRVIIGDWQLAGEGATVTPCSAGDTLPLNVEGISQVALAVRNGKRIVRPARSFSLRDVAALIESCADEQDFSLCFKSLNDRAPAAVNLVSKNVPERTMSPTPPVNPKPLPSRGHSLSDPSRPKGAGGLVLAAVCVVVLIQTVVIWSTRASAGASDQSATMQDNIIRQLKSSFAQQIEKTVAIHRLLQDEQTARKEIASALESRLALASDEREKLRKELVAASKAIAELREQLDGIKGGVVVGNNKVDELRKEMQILSSRIEGALRDIDAKLSDLATGQDAEADPESKRKGDDR